MVSKFIFQLKNMAKKKAGPKEITKKAKLFFQLFN